MNNHDPARIHPARHGRRRWLALLAGTSLIATVSAQNVSLYSFSSGTGTTLDPMSGASTLLGSNQDDTPSAVTNIGFSFSYEGASYTQFSINSNGCMRLGGTQISGSFVNSVPTGDPVLLPYSGDGTTANGSVSTVLTGSSPNQVRVVQWNAGMDYNVSSANILYQVWLYEGTNAIEFRYGAGAPSGTFSNGMLVAVAGATTYLNVLSNLTASSSNATKFSTATANGWPGNGTILTFTPPAGNCTTPTPGNTVAAITSICPGQSASLSLQNAAVGFPNSYQWQSSPDGSTWSNISGATSATHTSSALTVSTWFQCVVTCGVGPVSATSTPVQITVSEPAMSYYAYTGAQINESFNTWTNRCSTGDVPGASSGYWRNAPAFGPGTWRASNTTTGASGWADVSGGPFSTTLASNPNAIAIAYPAARFHSRQGSSVVGTLDFYVNMSAATGAEKLRFEYINSAGNGNLGVWVSTDGGSNFTQVGSTLTSTALNTWEMKEFTIGSTSAITVIRLRGTAGAGASGNDIAVDNFRIIPASTCAAPTVPTASVTGPGTVNIGWTCASCTGDFYVEYKNASFTPGTGASAGGGTVAGPFTSSPATLTGLPAGNYRAYVRRDCGGGNGFSENVGAVTFGIVNGDFCANAIDLSTASHADWTVVANTTGASNDYTSSACASQPGPDVVLFHDVAPGATLSLGLWSSSNRMSVAYGSVCPGTTNLACSSAGYFTVGGSVQDIDGFPTLIWTNNGCQTERIHVLADGTSTGGEVYIFNYAYTPAAGPFCPAVTGIAVNTVNTGTGAGLSWNATCSGNVIVEYGPAGFTPGTGASANGGTAVPVSGTSTTLSGLDLDTPYDVYVRQDCSGGTFSANGSATSFTLHNGDDCSRVLALIGESGSLTLNTTGANNDISVCGAGNTGGDLVLSYVVQPGYGIYFASAPSAPYSGQVRIAYGNTCPGGTEVYCQAGAVDQFWLNETGDVQTVYLIQDGTDEGSTTVEWSYFPACALLDTDGDGINDCDDSCPELPGGVGDPCTIGGNPGTISEGCTCVAAACTGNQAVVVIRTDANGGQTTWQIQDAFAFTVASGGPYTGQDNTVINTNVCLPTTFGSCYSFYLFDSFGDGLCCANGEGYWELRTTTGDLLLRDRFEATPDGHQSPAVAPVHANYLAHEFCLPVGPSNIMPDECGVFTNTLQSKVYSKSIPGVSQYQFEFTDPDGGFRRRIAVPRNWVKFSEMQTVPLVPGVTYFARVRVDQGAVGFADDHFGTGCEMGLSPNAAGCTGLIDDTDLPTHSCGVTKRFGASDKIWARPLVGATAYKFRFVNSGEGFVRQIERSSYICLLSWTDLPLHAGTTYDVQVNAFVNGAWTGFCGSTCQVTIAGPGNRPETRMAEVATAMADVHLWPNPNTGERMNVQADGFDASVNTVAIDVLDLSGKVVHTRTLPVMHGLLNTVLDLGPLDNGTYLMRFSTRDHVQVERFVVQH